MKWRWMLENSEVSNPRLECLLCMLKKSKFKFIFLLILTKAENRFVFLRGTDKIFSLIPFRETREYFKSLWWFSFFSESHNWNHSSQKGFLLKPVYLRELECLSTWSIDLILFYSSEKHLHLYNFSNLIACECYQWAFTKPEFCLTFVGC